MLCLHWSTRPGHERSVTWGMLPASIGRPSGATSRSRRRPTRCSRTSLQTSPSRAPAWCCSCAVEGVRRFVSRRWPVRYIAHRPGRTRSYGCSMCTVPARADERVRRWPTQASWRSWSLAHLARLVLVRACVRVCVCEVLCVSADPGIARTRPESDRDTHTQVHIVSISERVTVR